MKQLLILITILNNFFGGAQVIEKTEFLNVDRSKSTIRTRFAPPRGFAWQQEKEGSFAQFLINFPLHPKGFPIRDFNAIPISHQNNHAALLKIDVGSKDLQQCADAWMRLYAEYLWMNQRYDEIGFEFTSGQFFSWNDYKRGVRTQEIKDRVKFINTSKKDNSYTSFREYLEVIFRYAGTISIDRESNVVTSNAEITTGDFIIKPGSPGHMVMIMGVARNVKGKKVYLLAEGFMPAQDIHILVNHSNRLLSPWYTLDVNATNIQTAKYNFKPAIIKRFRTLW